MKEQQTASKLELRDIVVRRGDRETLRVDRLAVSAGEVLAVIGPNGAGKTTLLQVAGLLLRPSEGEVRIDGESVGRDTLPFRRRIAVAMQETLLLDGSVLENAALGLKLRGVGKRERERAAREWLRRFGVEHLAERPANKVSGGEARRAGLARAFAVRPELLLLDEPFSGLDEPTRRSLLDDLAALIGRTGVATVLVTHDRDEALRLGDSIAVVLDGRLRQWAAATDVFGAPADEEVAAFVGVENILAGRIVDLRGGIAAVDVGGNLISAVAGDLMGGQVRVCLRPEDVFLQEPFAEARGGSARNLLSGVIQDVRVSGPQARVRLECGSRDGEPVVISATVTSTSVEEMGLEPGRSVVASFKATAVHLLPGEEGASSR
jgi:tungstate transport system ATP-binding protein